MDAQLPGGGAVVAFMGRQHFFQVHPFELAAGQFQGDASMHHLGYENSQLFSHSMFSNERLGTSKVASRCREEKTS